ncbi:Arc family DNA-binding protein [Acinetobacter junii]|uniref:Arc family DNA-binding protein n=1 Tax=Acinetobacter junii TaxID=40215 RepID=UPI003A839344
MTVLNVRLFISVFSLKIGNSPRDPPRLFGAFLHPSGVYLKFILNDLYCQPQWGVLLLKHFQKLIIDMSKHLGVEYKVRMPQELKDKIAESAKELNRSMNADIVARLEQTFNDPLINDPKSMIDRFDKVISIIEQQEKTIKNQDQTITTLKNMLDELSVSATQAVELLKKKAP